MGDSRGIDERVEADWRSFRARLADRLERLTDEDYLRIAVETPYDGPAPFVQFAAFRDGIHAEAAGGPMLDELEELPSELWPHLDVRWTPAGNDGPYFHTMLPVGDVDRLAVESVYVLRELMGVVHPSFLSADGLEVDPAAPTPVEDVAPEPPVITVDEEPATHVASRDHLHDLVETALKVLLQRDEILWDHEDDAPIRSGESMVFVRVGHDGPTVRVFSEIVVQPDDERLAVELELLNRSHPYAKFYVHGEAVVMSYTLNAFLFVPETFRAITQAFLNEVDEVAATLQIRVGGRRFFDPEPEPAPEPELVDLYPGLAMLLELIEDHHLTSARVAALFEHSKHAVLEAIAAIRAEAVDLGDQDADLVMTLLRKGLRAIVDDESARHRGRKQVPPKPRRSRQESLDLGRAG